MDSPFYNIHTSYESNFNQGPIGIKNVKKPYFKIQKPRFTFLGSPIHIPFGIPAGPLLNSKFVSVAFDFGFAVCTYKPVRSDAFPCHPFPNVVFLDAPAKFNPKTNRRLVAIKNSNQDIVDITITNSFGVPSKKPSFWQKDVISATSMEKSGQLLIVSFMSTVRKNQTQKEFINDFVETARLAKETNVKVLEVNLSCPNIGNEGLVCYDLSTTKKVCAAIRNVIGNTPLILKVGYYTNDKDIEKIAEIVHEYANSIAAINTIQAEIVDKNGKQALPGPNRLKSGVCGHAIKWAGIEIVKKLKNIRQKKNYKFEIIGIGGVLTPKDYFDYRKAGADVVQSATGAMWNPYLAYEIWKKENGA